MPTLLGKLAMIASPGIAGFALAPRPLRRASRVSWTWVCGAAAITLLVALGALVVAIALGWAAGGLVLATAAYGRRWGVLILGLVWAAWHLIPAARQVGLFPYLETAPPLMIAAFIASCVIYRELLTLLREKAGSWLGAAAGHAAPNILLAGLIAAGVGLSGGENDWPLFPAPGGLVFPSLVLIAVLVLRRPADRSRHGNDRVESIG